MLSHQFCYYFASQWPCTVLINYLRDSLLLYHFITTKSTKTLVRLNHLRFSSPSAPPRARERQVGAGSPGVSGRGFANSDWRARARLDNKNTTHL